jgi:hypothetical protein
MSGHKRHKAAKLDQHADDEAQSRAIDQRGGSGSRPHLRRLLPQGERCLSDGDEPF